VTSAAFALSVETSQTADATRATVTATGEIDITNTADFIRSINDIAPAQRTS
jgi:hypothetical protein